MADPLQKGANSKRGLSFGITKVQKITPFKMIRFLWFLRLVAPPAASQWRRQLSPLAEASPPDYAGGVKGNQWFSQTLSKAGYF